MPKPIKESPEIREMKMSTCIVKNLRKLLATRAIAISHKNSPIKMADVYNTTSFMPYDEAVFASTEP